MFRSLDIHQENVPLKLVAKFNAYFVTDDLTIPYTLGGISVAIEKSQ